MALRKRSEIQRTIRNPRDRDLGCMLGTPMAGDSDPVRSLMYVHATSGESEPNPRQRHA